MRVNIKTKKRRLMIATGDDAREAERPSLEELTAEWVRLDGADFSIAESDDEGSLDGDEEDWIPNEMSFGFAPKRRRTS